MADDTPENLKSVEERDQEWLDTVYRGDKEKDLTPRAVLAGMVFGGLMSLSNLYVGLKSGWGLGVDIAAVIVIFAVFKALRGIGIVKQEFGIMENTMMMTVAVAASWISSAGLVSAVPALTMLTGYQFVWWQLTLFIGVILYMGLFMAIPLKRQMIQIEPLRFPANIPTGETLRAMYSHGGEAMKKAKALGLAGALGMIMAGLRDGLEWIPSQVNLGLSIGRINMSKLTLSLEPSLIFIGIGALFGIKVGFSMLLGLILNYGVLAPNLIEAKIIRHPAPQIRAVAAPKLPLEVQGGQALTVVLEQAITAPELASGATTNVLRYTWTQPATYASLADLGRDLAAPTLKDGAANPFCHLLNVSNVLSKAVGANVLFLEAPLATNWEARLSIPADQPTNLVAALGFKPGAKSLQAIGGFRNISAWSLWPGATVLVVGGLLALAFQWRTLGRTFAGIFTSFGNQQNRARGVLDHLEIPMAWFVIGFPVTGILGAILLTWLFSIHWYMGLLAVGMTFFLAAVAARAGAEIGINPIGALGKVTQLTYGVIAPGNISANLMTAGITAGAACSCSDTVGNLKVGHMVGANPRRQFIAQLFGVLAGALLAVPAYFILVPDANALGGEKFPAPSALVWMGVAKVLSQGLSTLPRSAVMAMIVAFVVGIAIVIIDRVFPKARPYTPSPAALGIALTIPAYTSFAMFLGAFIVWILEKKAPKWNDSYTIPIASGCIAGESIMGVILAALMALGVMH
ncbi:MAG: OPT family oligopeptide transporter [Verrucomicrobiota bacterium]